MNVPQKREYVLPHLIRLFPVTPNIWATQEVAALFVVRLIEIGTECAHNELQKENKVDNVEVSKEPV